MVYGDHLYGFDTNYFTCVRAADGKKLWKERGYGSGQVLLLSDQGLLLVLAEQGEVALVEANPSERKEIARFKAIDGNPERIDRKHVRQSACQDEDRKRPAHPAELEIAPLRHHDRERKGNGKIRGCNDGV